MWHWYLLNPEYGTDLDRARQQRAEAVAGASYRAIDAVARLFGGIGAAAATAAWSVIGSLRRWQRRRATLRTLTALDDRMLTDIGLRRTDLPWVVDALLRSPRRDGTPVPTERASPSAGPAEFRPKMAA